MKGAGNSGIGHEQSQTALWAIFCDSKPVNGCGQEECSCKKNMWRKGAPVIRPLDVSQAAPIRVWNVASDAAGNPQVGSGVVLKEVVAE